MPGWHEVMNSHSPQSIVICTDGKTNANIHIRTLNMCTLFRCRTISIAWIILGHTYFYTDVVHYHHYRELNILRDEFLFALLDSLIPSNIVEQQEGSSNCIWWMITRLSCGSVISHSGIRCKRGGVLNLTFNPPFPIRDPCTCFV